MEDRYLYKAKRVDNGEWVEGCLLVTESKGNLEPLHYFICPIKHEGMYRVIPETLCQCTGLKDKNGKLIWENDIVELTVFDYNGVDAQYMCKVEFGCCGIHFDGNKFESHLAVMDCDPESDIEIIGNIFDNPELMEV